MTNLTLKERTDTMTMCAGCAGDGLTCNDPCDVCDSTGNLHLSAVFESTFEDRHGTLVVTFERVRNVNGVMFAQWSARNAQGGHRQREQDEAASRAFQGWIREQVDAVRNWTDGA